jgi:UDP-N-acetylmuramate-alanine ligase
MQPHEVIDYLQVHKTDVLLTIGAGDIDRIVEPLKKAFS